MTYYIYILHCNNGSYYTGFTTDIERRYREHINGTSKCKYTRSFKPVALSACWAIEDNRSMALKIEKGIKGLTKLQKTKLCDNPELLLSMLSWSNIDTEGENFPRALYFIPT